MTMASAQNGTLKKAAVRLVGAFLVVAASLPLRAVPPDSGAAAEPSSLPASLAETRQVQPNSYFPSVVNLGGWFWSGFLILSVLGNPQAAAAQPAPPSPGGSAAAAALASALAQVNGSGILPPMGALNDRLASALPSGSPLLDSVQSLIDLPNPSFPSQSYSTQPAEANLLESAQANETRTAMSDELIAAGAALEAAALTEAYYLQASIGFDLAAAAYFLYAEPALSGALNGASNILLSSAHLSGAAASQVQVDAAKYALSILQGRSQAESGHPAAAAPAAEGSHCQASPFDPFAGGFLDPNLIYGTWERPDFDSSGQVVIYRITPTGLVKFHARPEGDEEVVTVKPVAGTVSMGEITYRRAKGSKWPSSPVAGVNLPILIQQPNGTTIVMEFIYLDAQGPSQPGQSIPVLVEKAGNHHLFVKH